MKKLLLQKAVGGAGTVVLTFLVHTESVLCSRTVNITLRNLVHTDRNSQYIHIIAVWLIWQQTLLIKPGCDFLASSLF